MANIRRRDRLAAARLIRDALAVMNDKGVHWTTGARRAKFWNRETGQEEHKFCAVGGLEHVMGLYKDLSPNVNIGGKGQPIQHYPKRGKVALVALAGVNSKLRWRDPFDAGSIPEESLDDRAWSCRKKVVRANDRGTWHTVKTLFEKAAEELEK